MSQETRLHVSPPPPRGDALVLLPGLVCDRASWEPMFAGLGASIDCQVYETGPDASLGAMAERVLATAPATFALAGHSMGGRVALEIVRRAPQRVERLALLDTGWRPLPPGVGGENERATRLRLHEEMATMIPGAILEVIDDCGHMAPMERPERVAAAMLSWLHAPLPDRAMERRWAN